MVSVAWLLAWCMSFVFIDGLMKYFGKAARIRFILFTADFDPPLNVENLTVDWNQLKSEFKSVSWAFYGFVMVVFILLFSFVDSFFCRFVRIILNYGQAIFQSCEWQLHKTHWDHLANSNTKSFIIQVFISSKNLEK